MKLYNVQTGRVMFTGGIFVMDIMTVRMGKMKMKTFVEVLHVPYIAYHWVCNWINTTGVTSVSPPEHLSSPPVISGFPVTRSLISCCVLLIVVCPFVFFF
jgi:hypothetical protein